MHTIDSNDMIYRSGHTPVLERRENAQIGDHQSEPASENTHPRNAHGIRLRPVSVLRKYFPRSPTYMIHSSYICA